ncbi:hypothetical protein [Acetobacter oeni]|uniref:Uncharacterized protein n=1 Tax=Acetobacter oeni TaxID=304077 RepID=A0A511XQY1_9PROT|nr:hypothetical protein [Acetobacter oeni]MBB3883736.1 hypothetical protein [Acetobacter oeni]NHO20851.1 hypothetical protein [Acetobacter oeni]GBR10238.1 hypothetical protein AA21952_3017 [Acetobacter oeni LMG 21952]GEN65371.1 hypothetical protein AOE01nite_35950 [Acetobacter oeni]
MTIAIVVLCLLWAVTIPTYWILWTRSAPGDEGHPAGYVAHESAFRLPDLTLALLLATTAILALLGIGAMRTTGLVAAGMMLFLGLIDFAYDLANGGKTREYIGDALLVTSACSLVALILIGDAS